jgi:hypothetical protein
VCRSSACAFLARCPILTTDILLRESTRAKVDHFPVKYLPLTVSRRSRNKEEPQ